MSEDDPNPPLSTYEYPVLDSLKDSLPEKEGCLVREANGSGKLFVLFCSNGNMEHPCECGGMATCYGVKEDFLYMFETEEDAAAAARERVLQAKKQIPWVDIDLLEKQLREFPYLYYKVVEFSTAS